MNEKMIGVTGEFAGVELTVYGIPDGESGRVSIYSVYGDPGDVIALTEEQEALATKALEKLYACSRFDLGVPAPPHQDGW